MDEATSRKLTVVGVAFGLAILGFVLAVPVAVVFANVYVAATGNELGGVGALGLSMISLQGVAFPLTAWLYVWRSDRSWSFVPAEFPDRSDAKYTVGAYLVAFVVVYALQVLITLASVEAASNQAATTAMNHPEIIPYLVPLMLVLVGPGEELLFRGVIQGVLRERFDVWPSILLASAAFAPLHIFALTGGLGAVAVTISVLFVPSIVFGYVYERTRNVVVPAVAHGLYNATLMALLYVAVKYAPESSSRLGF
ncbi:MAG: lysostaphin resistance A-like protein [Halobacterium sp.]